MKMYYNYLVHLYDMVPNAIIYGSLLLSLFISLLIISYKGTWTSRRQVIVSIILAEYYFLLLCSTVLYRAQLSDYQLVIKAFWSYLSIMEGNNPLLMINILNILMFLPFGVMCCILFNQHKFLYTIATCVLLSSMIEVMQLITRKGVCEIDDLCHNILGGVIGCLSMLLFIRCRDVLRRYLKNDIEI